MPYISTEALVGAALLIVIAFGYQFIPQSTKNNASMPGSKASKKKPKKKSKHDTEETKASPSPPPIVEEKKGKKSKLRDQAVQDRSVDVKDNEEVKSFAAVAADGVVSSSAPDSITKVKPKTLAEKLAPQPRKSKVDDMLAPEDRPPTHARVMKIVPESTSEKSTQSTPKPTSTGASKTKSTATAAQTQKISKFEDDYVESSGDETSGDMGGTVSNSGTGTGIEEDDGWDVVPIKKKKPVSISSTSRITAAQSTALPLGVATKLQRQNQARSAAKKAATEAAEADRLQRLAQHRKELERERINEIYNSGKKPGQGKGKVLSGGATATVTPNGKLVWD